MKPFSITLKSKDKEGSLKEKHYSFSANTSKVLLISTLLGSFVALSGAIHYLNLFSTVVSNDYLESENKTLRTKLKRYRDKIKKINKNLKTITNFEKRLKSFANLDKTILTKPYYTEKEIDELKTTIAAPLRPTESLERADADYQKFDAHLDQFQNKSTELKEQLSKLTKLYSDRKMIFHALPTLFPTIGWITSFYGKRKNPVTGRYKLHAGLDIGASYGAPILAAADGIVVYSGYKSAMGKVVQVDHGYGIQTTYAHSQKLLVRSGEAVSKGQTIARVGSTGHSTGPHLHYEVRINGIPVDPYYFLIEQ